MSELTLATAQQYEYNTQLRLKFASIDDRGQFRGDALDDEYPAIVSGLPSPWRATAIGMIETRTEATRPAWHLTDGDIDLVAVEHETGLEILVIGVVSGLVVNAVTGLARWAWKKWTKLRAGSQFKVESSLVVEVPRPAESGVARAPLRLVIPSPVSDQDIARYVRAALELERSVG